ncbi:hypothetical protein GCK32_018116, partial [Trichostrongylus colubriformis]
MIEELPSSISSLSKLRILNVGMNRLSVLPRGFGSFKSLEILDLTYNNLNERSLPGNFFFIGAHVMARTDNMIEELPSSISSLSKLRILNVGMNRLSVLPRGFGSFKSLEILDLTYNNLNERSLPGNFFFI